MVRSVKPPGLSRAERTQRNRERMVEAAYGLFVDRGYTATTMADIAAAAGVAEQTLYYAFGSKPQLLQRTYDLAVTGPGNAVPPEQQAWFRSFQQADSLGAALTLLVDNVGNVFARTAPLDEMVRAAAVADPAAADARRATEAMRRHAWSVMIDRLNTRFEPRAGVDRTAAIDSMLVIMSPTTYHTLVTEYGWSLAAWSAWCRRLLAEQLFARLAE